MEKNNLEFLYRLLETAYKNNDYETMLHLLKKISKQLFIWI